MNHHWKSKKDILPSQRKRLKALTRDLPDDGTYAPDGFGVILQAQKSAVPVSEAFADDPEGYEAHFRALEERVAREMAEGGAHARSLAKLKRPKRDLTAENKRRLRDVGRTAEWIRVYSCGFCRRVLISPNQPEVGRYDYERKYTLERAIAKYTLATHRVAVAGREFYACHTCLKERPCLNTSSASPPTPTSPRSPASRPKSVSSNSRGPT